MKEYVKLKMRNVEFGLFTLDISKVNCISRGMFDFIQSFLTNREIEIVLNGLSDVFTLIYVSLSIL